MNEEQSINRQEPMHIDLIPLIGTAVQHTGITTTLSNGNSIIASSGDSPLLSDIRRIVAEEIEKALPRITSAVLEQIEQRVRLSRGTHKEQAE